MSSQNAIIKFLIACIICAPTTHAKNVNLHIAGLAHANLILLLHFLFIRKILGVVKWVGGEGGGEHNMCKPSKNILGC